MGAGMTKFSSEEVISIASRFESGDRAYAMADEYNCGVSAIYRAIRSQGVRVGRGLPVRDDAFTTMSPEVAYWIGFLLADGNVHHDKRTGRAGRISLALSPIDEAHVLRFGTFINYVGAIERRPTYTRIAFTSRRIAADLASYGVVPKKSLIASVDPRLAEDRDFWRGMVDGDGSVALGSDGYARLMLCGTEAVCEAFRRYITSRIATRSRVRKLEGRQVWAIEVHGNGAAVIVRLLYDGAAVALPRKASIASQIPSVSPRFSLERGPLRPPRRYPKPRSIGDRGVAALRHMMSGEEAVVSGLSAWVDAERFAVSTIYKLLAVTALTDVSDEGGLCRYAINSTGRAILSRPQLADEIAVALCAGRNFTIRDNQIREIDT